MKLYRKSLEAIKNRFRPYISEEPISLTQLFICKIIMGANCAAHWMSFLHLRATFRERFRQLSENRAKNAFVFANGPSLNDLDFTKIKTMVENRSFDLIAVNSFASMGISKYGICPTLMVYNDPFHYLPSNGDDISDQAKHDIEIVNKHDISVIVPHKYFSKSRFKLSIPYCGTYYPYGKNMANLSLPLGHNGVTAFSALSAALQLGYEQIFICGYDNSYFKGFEVDRNNRKMFADIHFHDERKREFPTSWCRSSSQAFLNFSRHFGYLEKFRKYAPAGVKIYNIALETYTDAFERNFELDVYKTPQDGQ